MAARATPPALPALPARHTDRLNAVVGPCPRCGRSRHWYNDVPLRAFCWGPDGAEHPELRALVPVPYNPYLPRDAAGGETALVVWKTARGRVVHTAAPGTPDAPAA